MFIEYMAWVDNRSSILQNVPRNISSYQNSSMRKQRWAITSTHGIICHFVNATTDAIDFVCFDFVRSRGWIARHG